LVPIVCQNNCIIPEQGKRETPAPCWNQAALANLFSTATVAPIALYNQLFEWLPPLAAAAWTCQMASCLATRSEGKGGPTVTTTGRAWRQAEWRCALFEMRNDYYFDEHSRYYHFTANFIRLIGKLRQWVPPKKGYEQGFWLTLPMVCHGCWNNVYINNHHNETHYYRMVLPHPAVCIVTNKKKITKPEKDMNECNVSREMIHLIISNKKTFPSPLTCVFMNPM
jgi:hypothetical protein